MLRFEQWLEGIAGLVFRCWSRHRVGILGTVAINLSLLVALLGFELRGRAYHQETVVTVDFEREYELEPPPEAPPLAARRLIPVYEAIRNIAVDASRQELNPGLTDEKNIDAEALYRDALRAREQMRMNLERLEEARGTDDALIPNTPQKNIAPAPTGQFKGPAVISFSLVGRRAHHLPVPAYLCERGGQVVVDIEVLGNGRVAQATIDAAHSVADPCIEAAARAAAMASLFSTSATPRQRGSITYLFVPQ